jgi:flagellar basal body-associated protein FliL
MERKKKGSLRLVIIIGLVALSLGAAAVVYTGAGKVPPKPRPPKHMVVKVGEFVTNLSGQDNRRFVRIQIDVETESEEAGKELIARTSQMRDQVLLVLRAKTVTDLSGPDGMRQLSQDIMDRLNQILSSGKALAIYFVEFAIQ